MTDKKQSAFARRLAELNSANDTNQTTSINNRLTELDESTNNRIIQTQQQLSSTTDQLINTANTLSFHLGLDSPNSLNYRITELENAPPSTGGGGIDPTDPEPIIISENYVPQMQDWSYSGGAIQILSTTAYGTVTSPRIFQTSGSTSGFGGNNMYIVSANSETDHFGVIEIVVEDGVTGVLSLSQSSAQTICVPSDITRMVAIVKTPASFPSGSSFIVGFATDLSTPTEGIYFIADPATNTWICTVNNGTSTSSNNTIALATNTWYTLEITKVTSSSFDFTINGTTINLSTNVPTDPLTCGLWVDNVSGTSPSQLKVKLDFFSLKLRGTTGGTLPTGVTVTGTANEVDVTFASNVYTIGLPSAIVVNEVTVDQVNFTMPVTSPTLSMGELAWDPDHNTIVYQLSSTVHVPLGTAVYQHVRNTSGVNILKGDIVYVSGSQGVDRLKVTKALANAEATSAPTIGLAAEDINDNADGYVVTYGLLHGVTTTGYPDGQRIYLSESTPGGWRTTLPSAPNHGTFVGWVVKGGVGGGAGTIFVKVHNYNELSELSDIYIPSTPADGDILQWDNTDGRWENRSLATAGIAAASHTHTLSGLTPLNQMTLVGRWASAGSGNAQEVTIGTGLKLSNTGILTTNLLEVASTSIILTAGTGLTGGGDLTTNRSFAVDFAASGTSSSTKAVRADDSRLSDARTPTAHTHPLSDLTQSSATLNQVPQWNGSNWVPATVGGGSPGGSTGQVQYNNASAFAGATNVKINSNNLELVKPASEPTTAPADSVIMYAKSFGQRDLPAFVDSSGWSTNLQTCIARNKFTQFNFNGNTNTAAINNGMVMTTTSVGTAGTAGGAVAPTTTSLLGGSRRQTYLTSTTAGSATGWRASVAQCWRGNGVGRGGFFCVWKFGIGDATIQSAATLFVGLNDSTAAPALVVTQNPITTTDNTMRNQVGLCLAGGSLVYQIAYRNGTAAASTISTGITANLTDIIEFCLYCTPNDSTIYYYMKVYADSGSNTEIFGNIGTSNIPANTTQFVPHMWRGNNLLSVACAVHALTFSVETPH